VVTLLREPDYDAYAMTEQYSFKVNDEEMNNWIESKVEDGPFANKSHLIRTAIKQLKENDESSPLV